MNVGMALGDIRPAPRLRLGALHAFTSDALHFFDALVNWSARVATEAATCR